MYMSVCVRGEGEGGRGKKKGVGLETKLKPCTSTHVKFTNGPNYDSLPDHTVKLQVKCKYVIWMLSYSTNSLLDLCLLTNEHTPQIIKLSCNKWQLA